MTKRNPTAAALAQPQYRQRVKPGKRDEAITVTPSSGCVFYDIGISCRKPGCSLCDEPRQADQWMPPARQMEG